MMFPTLRGGNTDSGRHEYFYGEVDDIHAAANRLAKRHTWIPRASISEDTVPVARWRCLAAETGGRFAAVFAFGARWAGSIRYPRDIFPPGTAIDARELRLRSPAHWLDAITTPTYLIEGKVAPSNADELDELCHGVRNTQIHCVPVYGSSHFSVIDRGGELAGAAARGRNHG